MTQLSRLVAASTAALCLGLAALSAQAFELRGFRGVHWGEGADALRGATLVQTDGDVACHQRESENLIFGDTALNGVRYCFHHDRLVMVVLDAAVTRTAFSQEFQRTYGRPGARNDKAESWGGSATSTTLATLEALGAQGARLTLSVSRIEPEAALRMLKLSSLDPATAPQRVAAAY
jgi:hypothetical protein